MDEFGGRLEDGSSHGCRAARGHEQASGKNRREPVNCYPRALHAERPRRARAPPTRPRKSGDETPGATSDARRAAVAGDAPMSADKKASGALAHQKNNCSSRRTILQERINCSDGMKMPCT